MGSTQYRHNILAGSQPVAVHTLTSTGVVTTSYLHPDHLGGIDSVTSDSGSLAQKMSFDAFGARRDPCTWGYVTACDQGLGLKSVTDRGYTSQEQLDNLGLVHMNGRVYDPSLGRFMSADPRIPDLYNSQDLNRYAYVNNNPLNSTDPSGFDPGNVNQPPMYVPPEMMNPELAAMIGANYTLLNAGAGNAAVSLYSGSNPTGNTDSPLFALTGSYADTNDVSTAFGGQLETDGGGNLIVDVSSLLAKRDPQLLISANSQLNAWDALGRNPISLAGTEIGSRDEARKQAAQQFAPTAEYAYREAGWLLVQLLDKKWGYTYPIVVEPGNEQGYTPSRLAVMQIPGVASIQEGWHTHWDHQSYLFSGTDGVWATSAPPGFAPIPFGMIDMSGTAHLLDKHMLGDYLQGGSYNFSGMDKIPEGKVLDFRINLNYTGGP